MSRGLVDDWNLALFCGLTENTGAPHQLTSPVPICSDYRESIKLPESLIQTPPTQLPTRDILLQQQLCLSIRPRADMSFHSSTHLATKSLQHWMWLCVRVFNQ